MTDTRKRILNAAREAFNRDGLGRVGVRDAARATDMSPGNLAYHFPTKDDLVTALVGELHDLNRSTAFVEPMESFSLESLYRAATAAMRNMLGYRFVLLDYVEAVRASEHLGKEEVRLARIRRERHDKMLSALVANGYVERAALAHQRRRPLRTGRDDLERVARGGHPPWLVGRALGSPLREARLRALRASHDREGRSADEAHPRRRARCRILVFEEEQGVRDVENRNASAAEFRAAREPTGPPPVSLWSDAARTRGHKVDPLRARLSAIRERHGEVSRYRYALRDGYLVSSAEGVKRVLQDNAQNYDKEHPSYRMLRRLFGNGLLTSEGDFWRRQRLARAADPFQPASASPRCPRP